MSGLIRVRFKTIIEDYRPVNWPVKYPYWCVGKSFFYSTLVSYADGRDYIMANWPEACDLVIEAEVDSIQFDGRLPKPEWYKEATE